MDTLTTPEPPEFTDFSEPACTGVMAIKNVTSPIAHAVAISLTIEFSLNFFSLSHLFAYTSFPTFSSFVCTWRSHNIDAFGKIVHIKVLPGALYISRSSLQVKQ